MLNMKPEAQLIFFDKVFGAGSKTATSAKKLSDAGVVFDVQLYTLKATYKGSVWQLPLAKGSTTLMKEGAGSLSPYTPIGAVKNTISGWLTGLEQKLMLPLAEMTPNSPTETKTMEAKNITASEFRLSLVGLIKTQAIPVIKVIREITGIGLKEAKDIVEIGLTPGVVLIKTFYTLDEAKNAWAKILSAGGYASIADEYGNNLTPIQPIPAPEVLKPSEFVSKTVNNPVPDVIVLRKAQALGQKTKGTSSGSVYHTVAFNDRVKIAARIESAEVHIRAEWQDPLPVELKRLEDNGLVMKSDYASTHIVLAGVPASRVIGAFLMSLEIPFTEVISNGANLVVG